MSGTMWLPQPVPKDLLLEVPIFCRINPLARPRLNYASKHIYQPLENQKQLLAEMQTHKQPRSIHEPVCVEILICLVSPSDTLDMPAISKEHGDIDNQAKAVLDALVKALILVDDKQVVSLHATRAYDVEDFCLIRIWSVDEKREVSPWDSSTALTSLKQVTTVGAPSTVAKAPSPSSPPVRGKRRS